METRETLAKKGLVVGTHAYNLALKESVVLNQKIISDKLKQAVADEALAKSAYHNVLKRSVEAKKNLTIATNEVAIAKARLAASTQKYTTAEERANLQKKLDVAITNASTAKTELNTIAQKKKHRSQSP